MNMIIRDDTEVIRDDPWDQVLIDEHKKNFYIDLGANSDANSKDKDLASEIEFFSGDILLVG